MAGSKNKYDEKKRNFLKNIFVMTGITISGIGGESFSPKKNELWKWSREAYFYDTMPRGVKCRLCPNSCYLSEGQTGTCQTRINVGGKLYTMAYGNPCAMHVDPIEKKPFFHFLPKSTAFSISTAGCNFSCLNCQNWSISQVGPKETQNYDLMPEEVVAQCQKYGCESIAFTYTEPTVYYEYMLDTAKISRQKGIRNLLISNGYINQEPLKKLIPYIDAANIDLKSFDDEIYQKLNGGRLQPILDTLLALKKSNVWLEITNLVVPTYTDKIDMIKDMCEWLVTNGFSEYPLHFSRFFPAYKLENLSPTPVSILIKAKEIALKSGMKYVYVGNVPQAGYEDTLCPKCNKKLVERIGFDVLSIHIKDNKCEYCKYPINGVWK